MPPENTTVRGLGAGDEAASARRSCPGKRASEAMPDVANSSADVRDITDRSNNA